MERTKQVDIHETQQHTHETQNKHMNEMSNPTNQSSNSNDNVVDFSSTLKDLKRHVDPNLVKQREGWRDRSGNVQMIDYVEWHTVADILDAAAPSWSHSVKDIRPMGDFLTVTVAITIDGV